MSTLPLRSRIKTVVLCKNSRNRKLLHSWKSIRSILMLLRTCRCHGPEIVVMVSRAVKEWVVWVGGQVNSWTFPQKAFWVWIKPWPQHTIISKNGSSCSNHDTNSSYGNDNRYRHIFIVPALCRKQAWWMTPINTMRISQSLIRRLLMLNLALLPPPRGIKRASMAHDK